MTAKNLLRVAEGGTYCHVYNRGIENRNIFTDEADYQTFLAFLEEYLSAPKTPESNKKDFTINGRVFRGVPHQPKNYFKKVELIAYSLKPEHFHLVLHQKTQKSLQAFIRSLCTRYSIYFNKKYSHTGALFDGPYKSAQVKDEKGLMLLTHYLHKASDHSTYPEYSLQRETPWLMTKVVLSLINSIDSYKNYIDNYEPNQEDKEMLRQITIDDDNHNLERRDLEKVSLKPWSRIPEMVAACAVFVLLLGLGVRNITTDSKNNPTYPVTLGTNTTKVTPSPTPSLAPNLKSKASETEATSTADIKPTNLDD